MNPIATLTVRCTNLSDYLDCVQALVQPLIGDIDQAQRAHVRTGVALSVGEAFFAAVDLLTTAACPWPVDDRAIAYASSLVSRVVRSRHTPLDIGLRIADSRLLERLASLV